MNFLRYVKRL